MTGIGTDQLWAALRQWGAATLTPRDPRNNSDEVRLARPDAVPLCRSIM